MTAQELVSRGLAFGYRPRGGLLQRARAAVAVSWFAALGLIVLLYENPVAIAAVLVATMLAAVRCRAWRQVMAAVSLAAPVALLATLINPIVSQQGVTVLLADVHVPVLGSFDVTGEAVVYGLVLGLRALALFALCALYVCTVDPDELLRLLRRRAPRSAITASLAVRIVPVLARDGVRLTEARRCRPGPKPGAATMARAVFARSLDRAGDAALALETRGYALAGPARARRLPMTTADLLVGASAVAVTTAAVTARFAGVAEFTDYPLTFIAAGPVDVAFSVTVALLAAAPFWTPGGAAGAKPAETMTP